MTTKVQVRFESFHPLLIGTLPETNILLPTALTPISLREALSQFVPEVSFENFDFLIDGQLLKESIDSFLTSNKWSYENLLSIFVISRIKALSIVNNIPADDWISSISIIKSSSSPMRQNILFGDYSGMLFSSPSMAINRNLKSIQIDQKMPIKSVVSGERYAVVSHGHSATIVSIENSLFDENCLIGPLEGHTDTVECSAILAEDENSTIIATGSYDKSIKIWEFNQSQAIPSSVCSSTLKGHSDAVTGISVIPSASTNIISSSLDGSTRQWDISTGEIVSSIPHGIPLLGISTSPLDPYICASPMADLTIRVWDVRHKFNTSQSYRTLHGHNLLPTSVVFSETSSTTLYSVGQDGTMKSWDLRVNGKPGSSDSSVSSISSSGNTRLLAIDVIDQYLVTGGDQGLDVFCIGN